MIETDEELVAAIRQSLGKRIEFSEVRMFGGTGFLMDGKIFVGTSKQGLLVRVGKERHRDSIKKPGVKSMVMGGRVSEGFVYVDPKFLDPPAIQKWLGTAIDFVKTLPRKPLKKKAKRSKEKTS
jgi:TfoX/Sxy family transcriptional regulator of competence genes